MEPSLILDGILDIIKMMNKYRIKTTLTAIEDSF